MRGIRTLKIVSDNLRAGDLPPLRRPSVKPDEPKTEELVRWGVFMSIRSARVSCPQYSGSAFLILSHST